MKYIFTFLMFSFSYASLYAQNDDNPKAQKIEALYVAYITKELKLTEAEAQKFWPVHTQYDNEIRAVNTPNTTMKLGL